MSDVLIKRMEMPTCCAECRFFVDAWCYAFKAEDWRNAYNKPPVGKRLDNCPLIEVPKHGRLIDADAAAKQGWTISRTYSASPNEMVYEVKTMTDEVLPTIIPASEEGET